MAVIENERMTERNGFLVPGIVTGQTIKQRIVEIVGLNKIIQQFLSFGSDIRALQPEGMGWRG